jgi:hypothetical protein
MGPFTVGVHCWVVSGTLKAGKENQVCLGLIGLGKEYKAWLMYVVSSVVLVHMLSLSIVTED